MDEKVNLDNLEKLQQLEDKGPLFGKRHIQMVLVFTLLAIGFSTRMNMSVAMVAMTDNTTSINPNIPTYDWQNTGVILSSFFWGYIVFQIFAGAMSRKYGAKWFLLGGMFVNCTACALIPMIAADLGSTGVIVCRMFQGLSQGFFYPSTHTILGTWAPREERSWMATVSYSGAGVGNIIATAVTGFISSSWLGWPISFYLFATLGYCWCIFWLFFGASSPASHPTITYEEKRYIQLSLKQHDGHEKTTVPWMGILGSKAQWAVVVGSIGSVWCKTTLEVEIPTYLDKFMQFDMKKNSVVTASPYAIGIPLVVIFGRIADYLITKQYFSTLNVRRIFQCIGAFIPAISLVGLAYVSENQTTLVVVLLTISQVSGAGTMSGSAVNQVDLSPRFSGVLMGISNGISQCVGLFAPLMVQFVVTDETDISLWRIIFITSACISILSAVIYCIFASGERQWWDSAIENDKNEKIGKSGTIVDEKISKC